ncbi:MerR family transcriptional regulator [Actinocorallia longicatena]|uniref:HTH merR-type domain-containing protein n=1 Tax=Actinocorallia longicatena TaxID=111803 RepID=A0ABP6Q2P2_9ACTN
MLAIDDDHAPLYTVGQVASMLGVQQAFLRRLDEHGVLSPSRTEGRQRRYSRLEIQRLQYVHDLVEQGMTLAAVRKILELEDRVRELEDALKRMPKTRKRASVPPLDERFIP